MITEETKCSLLPTCEKTDVAPHPWLTTSGSQDCEPEQFLRRACTPACPAHKSFCLGRCVFSRACFFGPCSSTPYRTLSNATNSCTEYALEAEEGKCNSFCNSFFLRHDCQRCIEDELKNNNAEHCTELSGNSCWHCSAPIIDRIYRCDIQHDDAIEQIKCIQSKIEPIIEECTACVCTLLCYWEPEGPKCQTCLENSQAAELFVDQDKCQQGWIRSKEDGKCYDG